MMHFDNTVHLFVLVVGITELKAEFDASQRNKCYEDGIFPDLSDCTRFYMCSAGKKTLFQCPAQLRFNPDILVCDWPINVICLKDIPNEGTSLGQRTLKTTTASGSKTEHVVTTKQAILTIEYVTIFPYTDSKTTLINEDKASTNVTISDAEIITEETGVAVIEATETTIEKNIAFNEDTEFLLEKITTSQNKVVNTEAVTDSIVNDERFVPHAEENVVHTNLENNIIKANDMTPAARDDSVVFNLEDGIITKDKIVTEDILITESVKMGEIGITIDEIIPDGDAFNEGVYEKPDAKYEHFIVNENYFETEFSTEHTTNDKEIIVKEGDNTTFIEGLVTTDKPIIGSREDKLQTYATEGTTTEDKIVTEDTAVTENAKMGDIGVTSDQIIPDGDALTEGASEKTDVKFEHFAVNEDYSENEFLTEDTTTHEEIIVEKDDNTTIIEGLVATVKPYIGTREDKHPTYATESTIKDKILTEEVSIRENARMGDIGNTNDEIIPDGDALDKGASKKTGAQYQHFVVNAEYSESEFWTEDTTIDKKIIVGEGENTTFVEGLVTTIKPIIGSREDEHHAGATDGTTTKGKIVTEEVAVTANVMTENIESTFDEIIPDGDAFSGEASEKMDAKYENFIVNEDYFESKFLIENTTNDKEIIVEDSDNTTFIEGLVTPIKLIIGSREDEHQADATEDTSTEGKIVTEEVAVTGNVKMGDIGSTIYEIISDGDDTDSKTNLINEDKTSTNVTISDAEIITEETGVAVIEATETTIEKNIAFNEDTEFLLERITTSQNKVVNTEAVTDSIVSDERFVPHAEENVVHTNLENNIIKANEMTPAARDDSVVFILEDGIITKDKIVTEDIVITESVKTGEIGITIDEMIPDGDAFNEGAYEKPDAKYEHFIVNENYFETEFSTEDTTNDKEIIIKEGDNTTFIEGLVTTDKPIIGSREDTHQTYATEGTTTEDKIVTEDTAVTENAKMGDIGVTSDQIIPDGDALTEGASEKTDVKFEHFAVNEDYSENEFLTEDTTTHEEIIVEKDDNTTIFEGLVATVKPYIGTREDKHPTYATESTIKDKIVTEEVSIRENAKMGDIGNTNDKIIPFDDALNEGASEKTGAQYEHFVVNEDYSESEFWTEDTTNDKKIIVEGDNTTFVEGLVTTIKPVIGSREDEHHAGATDGTTTKGKIVTEEVAVTANVMTENIESTFDEIIPDGDALSGEDSEKMDAKYENFIVNEDYFKSEFLIENTTKDKEIIVEDSDNTTFIEGLVTPIKLIIGSREDEHQADATEDTSTEGKIVTEEVAVTGNVKMGDIGSTIDEIISDGDDLSGGAFEKTDNKYEHFIVNGDHFKGEFLTEDITNYEEIIVEDGVSTTSIQGLVTTVKPIIGSREDEHQADVTEDTTSKYKIVTEEVAVPEPVKMGDIRSTFDEIAPDGDALSRGVSEKTVAKYEHFIVNEDYFENEFLTEDTITQKEIIVEEGDNLIEGLVTPIKLIIGIREDKHQTYATVTEETAVTENTKMGDIGITIDKIISDGDDLSGGAFEKMDTNYENFIVNGDYFKNEFLTEDITNYKEIIVDDGDSTTSIQGLVTTIKPIIGSTEDEQQADAMEDTTTKYKIVAEEVAVTEDIKLGEIVSSFDERVSDGDTLGGGASEKTDATYENFIVNEDYFESEFLIEDTTNHKEIIAEDGYNTTFIEGLVTTIKPIIGSREEHQADATDGTTTKDKIVTEEVAVTANVKIESTFDAIILDGDALSGEGFEKNNAKYEHFIANEDYFVSEFLIEDTTNHKEITVEDGDNTTFIEGLVTIIKPIIGIREDEHQTYDKEEHVSSWFYSNTTSSSVHKEDGSLENTDGGSQERTNDTVDMNLEGIESGTLVGAKEYIDINYNAVSPEDAATEEIIKSANMVHATQKVENDFDIKELNFVEELTEGTAIDEKGSLNIIEVDEQMKAGSAKYESVYSNNIKIPGDIVFIKDRVINEDVSAIVEKSDKILDSGKEEAKMHVSTTTEDSAQQTFAPNVKQAIDKVKLNLIKGVSEDEAVLKMIEEDKKENEDFVVVKHTKKSVIEASEKVEILITKKIDSTVTEAVVERFSSPDVENATNKKGPHVMAGASENTEDSTVTEVTDKGGFVVIADSIAKDRLGLRNYSEEVELVIMKEVGATVTQEIEKEFSVPDVNQAVYREESNVVGYMIEDKVIINRQNSSKKDIVDEVKLLMSKKELESASEWTDIHDTHDIGADEQKSINVNNATIHRNAVVVDNMMKIEAVIPDNAHQEVDLTITDINAKEDIVLATVSNMKKLIDTAKSSIIDANAGDIESADEDNKIILEKVEVDTVEPKISKQGNKDILGAVETVVTEVAEGILFAEVNGTAEGISFEKSIIGKEGQEVDEVTVTDKSSVPIEGNISVLGKEETTDENGAIRQITEVTKQKETVVDKEGSINTIVRNEKTSKGESVKEEAVKGSNSDVSAVTKNELSSQDIRTVVDRESTIISKEYDNGEISITNEDLGAIENLLNVTIVEHPEEESYQRGSSNQHNFKETSPKNSKTKIVVNAEALVLKEKLTEGAKIVLNRGTPGTILESKKLETIETVKKTVEVENPPKKVAALTADINKGQLNNKVAEKWPIVDSSSTNPSTTASKNKSVAMKGFNSVCTIVKDQSNKSDAQKIYGESTTVDKYIEVESVQPNEEALGSQKYPKVIADITDVFENQTAESKIANQQTNGSRANTEKMSVSVVGNMIEGKQLKTENVVKIAETETSNTILDGLEKKKIDEINLQDFNAKMTKNRAESETTIYEVVLTIKDNFNDANLANSNEKSHKLNGSEYATTLNKELPDAEGGIKVVIASESPTTVKKYVETIKTNEVVSEKLKSTSNGSFMNAGTVNTMKQSATEQDSNIDYAANREESGEQDVRNISLTGIKDTTTDETAVSNGGFTDSSSAALEGGSIVVDDTKNTEILAVKKMPQQENVNTMAARESIRIVNRAEKVEKMLTDRTSPENEVSVVDEDFIEKNNKDASNTSSEEKPGTSQDSKIFENDDSNVGETKDKVYRKISTIVNKLVKVTTDKTNKSSPGDNYPIRNAKTKGESSGKQSFEATFIENSKDFEKVGDVFRKEKFVNSNDHAIIDREISAALQKFQVEAIQVSEKASRGAFSSKVATSEKSEMNARKTMVFKEDEVSMNTSTIAVAGKEDSKTGKISTTINRGSLSIAEKLKKVQKVESNEEVSGSDPKKDVMRMSDSPIKEELDAAINKEDSIVQPISVTNYKEESVILNDSENVRDVFKTKVFEKGNINPIINSSLAVVNESDNIEIIIPDKKSYGIVELSTMVAAVPENQEKEYISVLRKPINGNNLKGTSPMNSRVVLTNIEPDKELVKATIGREAAIIVEQPKSAGISGKNVDFPDADNYTKTSIPVIEHTQKGQNGNTVARDGGTSMDARISLTNNSVENLFIVDHDNIQTVNSKSNIVLAGYPASAGNYLVSSNKSLQVSILHNNRPHNLPDKGVTQANAIFFGDNQINSERNGEKTKLKILGNTVESQISISESNGTQNNENGHDKVSQMSTNNALQAIEQLLSSNSEPQNNGLRDISSPYSNENVQEREPLSDGTISQNKGNGNSAKINQSSYNSVQNKATAPNTGVYQTIDIILISGNHVSQSDDNGDVRSTHADMPSSKNGGTQEDENGQSTVQDNQPFRGDTGSDSDATVITSLNIANIVDQISKWDSNYVSNTSILNVSVEPKDSWKYILDKWAGLDSKERKYIKHEMKKVNSKEEYKKNKHKLKTLLKEKKQELTSSSEEEDFSKRKSSSSESSKRKLDRENKAQKRKKAEGDKSISEENETLSSKENSSKKSTDKVNSKKKKELIKQKQQYDNTPSFVEATGRTENEINSKGDLKENKHNKGHKKRKNFMKMINIQEDDDSKENVILKRSSSKSSEEDNSSHEQKARKGKDEGKGTSSSEEKMFSSGDENYISKEKATGSYMNPNSRNQKKLQKNKHTEKHHSNSKGIKKSDANGEVSSKEGRSNSNISKAKIKKEKKSSKINHGNENESSFNKNGIGSGDISYQKYKHNEKQHFNSKGKCISSSKDHKYSSESEEDEIKKVKNSQKNKHKENHYYGSTKAKEFNAYEAISLKEGSGVKNRKENESSRSDHDKDASDSYENKIDFGNRPSSKHTRNLKTEKHADKRDIGAGFEEEHITFEDNSTNNDNQKRNQLGETKLPEDNINQARDHNRENRKRTEKKIADNTNIGMNKIRHDDIGSISNEQTQLRDRNRIRRRNRQNITASDEEKDSHGQNFDMKTGKGSVKIWEWSRRNSNRDRIHSRRNEDPLIDNDNKDADCTTTNRRETNRGRNRCRRRSRDSDRNRKSSRRDRSDSDEKKILKKTGEITGIIEEEDSRTRKNHKRVKNASREEIEEAVIL